MTLTVTNPHHRFGRSAAIFTPELDGHGLGAARTATLPAFTRTTEFGPIFLCRFAISIEELDLLALPGTLAMLSSLEAQIRTSPQKEV